MLQLFFLICSSSLIMLNDNKYFLKIILSLLCAFVLVHIVSSPVTEPTKRIILILQYGCQTTLIKNAASFL